jgi:hypothetical protein
VGHIVFVEIEPACHLSQRQTIIRIVVVAVVENAAELGQVGAVGIPELQIREETAEKEQHVAA